MYKLPITKATILAALMMAALVAGFILPKADITIDQIVARLQQYSSRFPTEKVYLHIAQPLYATGEKIWYKAYVPEAISTILYVDLISPSGNVVVQQQLRIEEDAAHGDLALPDTLTSGRYLLRGYTRWMRNFDPAYFFSKEITVVSSHRTETMMAAQATEEPGLRFYPEGGQWVNGLASKVGFRATDATGKGLPVHGEIVDQDGKVMASLESIHQGLGAFVLQPKARSSFVAKVRFGQDQAMKTFPLPPALDEGVTMQVDNTSPLFITVEVQATRAFALQHEQAYVIAQAGGKPYYVVEGKLNAGYGFAAEIPRQDVPAGVLHLTLFTREGQPLCERLVFVAPKNTTHVEVQTRQITYGQREKVEMTLHTTDGQGKAVPAHLSVAVIDASLAAAGPNRENILSSLLLTADLQENIGHPAYYFDPEYEQAAKHLDLLMLTQAWQRFAWDEILDENEAAPAFEMERGLSLSGVALTRDNQSLTHQTFQFYFLHQGVGYTATTDAAGRFNIPVLDYYGPDHLLYEIADMDRTAIQITLDEPFAEAGQAGQVAISIDPNIQAYLSQAVDRSRIEESYAFYDAVPTSAPADDISLAYQEKIYPEADYSRDLEEYVAFPNMKEVIKEIVPNVSLRERAGGYQLRLYSEENRQTFEDTPLFLIDGVPTYDTDFMMQMNPDNIRLIELLLSRRHITRFGYPGRHGIMAIYTREGNFDERQLPFRITLDTEGFYEGRTYGTPQYETTEVANKRRPDFRPLLYWNPEVQTDENGIAHITFYTSDDIGNYKVQVEGMTAAGMPLTGTTSFQIISSQ